LALAVAFAQQWQLDYIHTLLKLKPVEIDPKQVHHLLQQYSPQLALKLLKSAAKEYNARYLQDTAIMYWQISKDLPHYKLPPRPRSPVARLDTTRLQSLSQRARRKTPLAY
jgi:hypothetical protein